MLALPWRSPGAPPSAGIELAVNRLHPLAAGLLGVWVLGRGTPRNLVTGELATPFGAPTQDIGVCGPALTNTNQNRGWIARNAAILSGRSEFTVAGLAMSTPGSSNGFGRVIYSERSSGNNILKLQWGTESRNIATLVYRNDAGNLELYQGASPADPRQGRQQIMSASLRPFGSGRAFCNYLDGTLTHLRDWGTQSTVLTQATTAVLGYDQRDASGAFYGEISLVAISADGWSDADHAQFARDPWAILRPAAPMVVSSAPAPPSGADHVVSASLAGAGNLAASGARRTAASVGLAGQATVSAAALRARLAGASLAGAGTLVAAATRQAATSAALAGQVGVAAAAWRARSAAAALAGTGTLTPAAVAARSARAALLGAGALTVSTTGATAHLVAVSLQGTAGLTAVVRRQARALAALGAAGTLSADMVRARRASASLAGSAGLAAASRASRVARLLLLADGRLVAAPAFSAAPVVASLRLARLVAPALRLERLVAAELVLARPIVIWICLDGRLAMASSVIEGAALECRLILKTPGGAAVTDASGVAVKAKPPGAAVRTYVVAPGAGAGEFLATVLFDLPGRWWISGTCTGPTPTVAEQSIEVRPRMVP